MFSTHLQAAPVVGKLPHPCREIVATLYVHGLARWDCGEHCQQNTHRVCEKHIRAKDNSKQVPLQALCCLVWDPAPQYQHLASKFPNGWKQCLSVFSQRIRHHQKRGSHQCFKHESVYGRSAALFWPHYCEKQPHKPTKGNTCWKRTVRAQRVRRFQAQSQICKAMISAL